MPMFWARRRMRPESMRAGAFAGDRRWWVRVSENDRGVAAVRLRNGAGCMTGKLVWVAFALGLAAAVPGLVLGLFGLPLGVAAAAVSLVALVRLTNMPPEQRRG